MKRPSIHALSILLVAASPALTTQLYAAPKGQSAPLSSADEIAAEHLNRMIQRASPVLSGHPQVDPPQVETTNSIEPLLPDDHSQESKKDSPDSDQAIPLKDDQAPIIEELADATNPNDSVEITATPNQEKESSLDIKENSESSASADQTPSTTPESEQQMPESEDVQAVPPVQITMGFTEDQLEQNPAEIEALPVPAVDAQSTPIPSAPIKEKKPRRTFTQWLNDVLPQPSNAHNPSRYDDYDFDGASSLRQKEIESKASEQIESKPSKAELILEPRSEDETELFIPRLALINESLAKFAQKHGYTFDWKLQQSWRAPADVIYRGDFESVLEQVITSLYNEGKPVRLILWQNKFAEVVDVSTR